MVVKAQVTDQVVIAELKAMKFSDEYVETPRRLIVSSTGREKTGKSHFAFTAPPPIVLFDIDIGTEGVVGKFQDAGKYFLRYEVRVPKEAKQDVYVPMWSDLKARIKKAYTLSTGTVVWDTATEAYELARLSHFGKLSQVQPHNYVEVNNEWRDLLRTAFDSTMNTVFIHKMKPVWLNTTTSDGKSRSTKTDRFELSGFSEMDYLAQVNVIHYREDSQEGGGMPDFSTFIKDCRSTPNVNGTVLRGPMCNFEFLLSLVHDKPKGEDAGASV